MRNNRFASSATTTLTVPNEIGGVTSQVFALHTISIADDVYTRLDVASGTVPLTIAPAPTWRHFKKGAIPDSFKEIAISGPLIDNLALFRNGNTYLQIRERPDKVVWGDAIFFHYIFATRFQIGQQRCAVRNLLKIVDCQWHIGGTGDGEQM